MKIIRVGVCDHALGSAQAQAVMGAMRRYDPLVVTELVPLPVAAVEGLSRAQRATRTLEQALGENRADVCVCSLEDLPIPENPLYPIVATSARAETSEVLLCENGSLHFDPGKPLLCAGGHRRVQMLARHTHWNIVEWDGDVLELLGQMDHTGRWGGVLLNASDLALLRVERVAASTYNTGQITPAAGQGIVAVIGRAGEPTGALARFHDSKAWDMAVSERTFARTVIGALGEAPVAARAEIFGDTLRLHGMLGDELNHVWRGTLSGHRRDALTLGAALAAQLMLDAGEQPAGVFRHAGDIPL